MEEGLTARPTGEVKPRLPTWLGDIHDFVDRLRNCGIQIGIDGEIRLISLLYRLQDQEPTLDDPQSVCGWLGPVICASAEEQDLFRKEFLSWADRNRAPREAVVAPGLLLRWVLRMRVAPGLLLRWVQRMPWWLPKPADPLRVPSASVRPDQLRKGRRWGLAGAVVLVSLLVIVLLQLLTPPLVPESMPPLHRGAELPVETTPPISMLGPRVIFACVPLVLLALLGYRRQRRRVAIDRRLTTQSHMKTVPVPLYTPPAALLGGATVQRALQRLGRHHFVPSVQIDIAQTIRATVHAGGRLQLRYALRRLPSDHLLLVDRLSLGDHVGALADLLEVRLNTEQVAVIRYDFHSDPRRLQRLSSEGEGPAYIDLDDLRIIHRDHRVIVVSDGSGLVDPMSGRAEPWLDRLASWPLTALLTPVPPEAWSAVERTLSEHGILVLPATGEGLSMLGALFEMPKEFQSVPSEVVDSRTGRLRASLADRPLRWISDLRPPPEDVRWMVNTLRDGLDVGGYELLCAVAVFPEIRPQITLALGVLLVDANGAPTLTDARLAALAALPWLRTCRMPSWLRVALIESLPENRAVVLRRVCRRLLGPGVEDTGGGRLWMQVARDDWMGALRSWLKRQPTSPLHDEIFVRFMKGRRLMPVTALEAPKSLRPQLGPGLSWYEWAVLSLLLGSSIALPIFAPELAAVLVRIFEGVLGGTFAPEFVAALVRIFEGVLGASITLAKLVTIPAIIFGLLIALILTGMPISISLGLTVLTFLFTMTEVPIESVALKLFSGIEKFEIMAIPFFILAGNFLTHGGMALRIINFAIACVGHLPGGLGIAGVFACALFAAVSGSSPATVVAIGSILLPAMVKAGFPTRFGAGVITTSGALGILIPPSIVMVMYAVATNTSVGQLFIAGIIPGIVLATMLGVVTSYRAWKNNYPRMPRASFGTVLRTFRDSMWGLLLIIIVIGGIYSGAFTPTEAAAMSAVYAFHASVFVYRDLGLKQVPKILLDSANMSAMLLYMIANAVLFSFLLTHENIPQAMAAWMIDQNLSVILFLLAVNILLLLAGNFLEPSSTTLIMAPILFPIAIKLGVDPIHFGIMMVVNMEVGMCHPPVGLNLYVASGITHMGITELTIAVWPWLMTMLVFLVLVTYWPALSLWLPRTLGMM